jgi:hypothetical protein
MVVSLDCTKLELLGEGIEKSLPNKSKEKLSACSRRKKGRSRNMKKVIPFLRSSLDDFPCNKSLKILCYSFASSVSIFMYRHMLKIFSYEYFRILIVQLHIKRRGIWWISKRYLLDLRRRSLTKRHQLFKWFPFFFSLSSHLDHISY